ncbi:MAG: aldo/keto reductase [Solirubrobacteraceae bacterium]|nr:aldo/keto reductase [Solirubrobacteraceae bacterium]
MCSTRPSVSGMTLSLPRVTLGGNVFGWTADEAQSFAVLDAAHAAGLTSIDTADVYAAWVNGGAGGQSEEIIGRWLAARPGVRDDVVIATKAGKLPALKGIRPEVLREALAGSLGRLGVDMIDLFYLHDDDGGDLRDTLTQLDAFVREGKVRALGLSNFSADRIDEAFAVVADAGLTAPEVLQPEYSLVSRDFEGELAPAAERHGLAVAPYYALASGFLTGKYRPGADVDSVRRGSAGAYLDDVAAIATLERLDEVAQIHDVPVASVALAWLAAQPTVVSPIASARTVEQVGPLATALTLELTTAELASLSAASAAIGLAV